MDAYECGVALAMRDAGIQKEAGIREFLKFLTTGRSTAFHGTSRAAAKSIREGKGVIPRHRRGIDAHIEEYTGHDPTGKRRLAFFTRSRPQAKFHAGRQGFLEGAGTTRGYLGVETLADVAMRGAVELPEQLKLFWKGTKGSWGGRRKGVVKVQYPAREFKIIRNPESERLAKYYVERAGGEMKNLPEFFQKTITSLMRPPFRRTFALGSTRKGRAAMPSRYIVGSPKYQRVSLPEIREHLRYAVQNPKTTVSEALRNLTGWQHLL